MTDDPLPTNLERAGLEYAHRAFSYNWHGVVRMAPSSAMKKLVDLVNQKPQGMFDSDIAAVMLQAEALAVSSPEQADQEWLTLREMVVEVISKAGGS